MITMRQKKLSLSCLKMRNVFAVVLAIHKREKNKQLHVKIYKHVVCI